MILKNKFNSLNLEDASGNNLKHPKAAKSLVGFARIHFLLTLSDTGGQCSRLLIACWVSRPSGVWGRKMEGIVSEPLSGFVILLKFLSRWDTKAPRLSKDDFKKSEKHLKETELQEEIPP